MIDEKRKVVFPDGEFATLSLGGVTDAITVKRYLSQNEQEVIMRAYLDELLREGDGFGSSFVRAENALIITIIEYCTDIQLLEERADGSVIPSATLDNIFSNFTIWQNIKDCIYNYDDFRSRLDFAIEEYKEQRRLSVSLGAVIEKLYTRLSDLIAGLSDMDFSPEKVEAIKGLIKEVEGSPVLQNSVKLFKDQTEK